MIATLDITNSYISIGCMERGREIFLERTRKLGDLIQKSSVQITRRLCDQLVEGDPTGLQRSDNPLW